jgi:hypothetical protein
MHVLINVKSPNNISKWQMGFNSAFKRVKSIFNGKNSPCIHRMFEIGDVTCW